MLYKSSFACKRGVFLNNTYNVLGLDHMAISARAFTTGPFDLAAFDQQLGLLFILGSGIDETISVGI